MEPKFSTSFIPKKSLQADVSGTVPGKYVNRRTVHGPGYFLSFLIFIIAVVCSVGIFGYTKVVEGRIQEKLLELDRARAAYKPETIDELLRVDARLRNAQSLIAGHIALTPLLTTLENLTLTNIKYTVLMFERGGEGDAGLPPTVQLTGVADTMPPVALLIDEYRKNPLLIDPKITALSLDAIENIVTFGVSAVLDPTIFSFTQAIKGGVVIPTPTPTPPETTVFATSTATTSSSISPEKASSTGKKIQ
jgi:hypothetical protein